MPRTYPTAEGTTGTELYIKEDLYPTVFAGDLPLEQARVLAASQRPAADVGFGEPLAVQPDRKITLVAGADRTINPDSKRAAAQRMGATMVEIDGGSHSIAMSQPDSVAAVILDAIAKTT